VTDVSFRSERITPDEVATVVVTIENPQSIADQHTVELELFGQVVNSREVTIPADDETRVQFTHDIVAPGTYTAQVGDETATIRVVDPGQSAATATPTSTSTQFPGFGPLAALVGIVVCGLALARRT
jgi:PGF-CTERM protein